MRTFTTATPRPSVPKLDPFSTTLMTAVGYGLWIGGNILLNIVALDWFNVGDDWPWQARAAVASIPSIGQHYLKRNWRNPSNLITGNLIIGIVMLILFVIDIIGPAVGALVFAEVPTPWDGIEWAFAVVVAIACSWGGQEMAVEGTGQLWGMISRRRKKRVAATTPAPDQPAEPPTPPATLDPATRLHTLPGNLTGDLLRGREG